MNQKAYSVLFCALLASTFVHELRAKGVAPVSSRLGVFERAASSQVCELECSFNQTVSFGLTIQVVENILVVANLSANVAILIDVSAQIVVALNGTSGAGIAIDIVAQTGVYVKSGLWVATKVTLDVFIKSLSGGLKAIFSISGAVSFNVSSASSAILVVINEIILKLVIGIDEDVNVDAKLGLQLLIAISKSIIILLKGSLKGLLDVIGSLVIRITNDLVGLVNSLQGISVIIVKVSGSLTALIEAGVVLDLQALLGASDGLTVLVNILLQIGLVINIGSALEGVFNNAESLFKLIAQLGGNPSFGVSGAFLVVANIVALINKNATIEVVISLIIEYVASSRIHTTSDLSASLNATLSGLLTVLKRLNVSGALSGLVSIVESLMKGNLVIGGVNISVILKKLLGVTVETPSLLVLIVSVVLQLEVVAPVSVLLPYLLLVLIFKLNSAIGIKQLTAIGINISVNLSQGIGGIIKSILANSFSLLAALLTGNFYDALSKLPVIGTIVVALNAAIDSSSNGKISLKDLLNVSTLVKNLLFGLIQYTTGFYLGVSQTVIAQVKAIVEAVGSVSSSVHFNITVSASASV